MPSRLRLRKEIQASDIGAADIEAARRELKRLRDKNLNQSTFHCISQSGMVKTPCNPGEEVPS